MQLARKFTDRDVTVALSGEVRPFPLDVGPRLLGALEWDLASRGIAQRVRAFEAFLADVDGEGRVSDEGLISCSVVTPNPHFCRAVVGTDPPNGVRATERHINVASGRDCDDVAPLKGVYQGPAAPRLDVVVAMSRTH